MGIAGPTHDQRSWQFDLDPGGRDPVLGIERLREAFERRGRATTRGITVPAIVDIPTGAVVTNDFAQITLDFRPSGGRFHRPGAPDLYPEALRDEIDEVNRLVFADINNGVYRCGFAGTQEAYDKAYTRLFDRLDWVADRLAVSATSWATPSPKPTCGCSPRWRASTPSTTGTSSATGRSWRAARAVGLRPGPVPDRPGSATRSTSTTSNATTTRSTGTSTPPASCPPAPTWPAGWSPTAARPLEDGPSATAPHPGLRSRRGGACRPHAAGFGGWITAVQAHCVGRLVQSDRR